MVIQVSNEVFEAPRDNAGIFRSIGFYIHRAIEYISVFGFSRGVKIVAEGFLKFKLAPRGARFMIATPRQGLVSLRAKTSDLSVYWEIFVDGQYDITNLKVFGSIRERYDGIKKRGLIPLIVDAGSNIGLASVYFSDLFPDADIILIEASRENCDASLLNTGSRPRLKVLHRALWAQRTKLRLCSSEDFSTLRVDELVKGQESDGDVDTITMQEVIDSHPKHELFMIKMDIEGAEHVVLSENNSWLSLSPVIFVEPHDSVIRHNKSISGLLAIEAYQKAEIILKKATLVFVPESSA